MSVASEPPITHAVGEPAGLELPHGLAAQPDSTGRTVEHAPVEHAHPGVPGRVDSAAHHDGHRGAGGTGGPGGLAEERDVADRHPPQAAGERAERPRLLRVAELGPPPLRDAPARGWRSELLARLPRLRPVPNVSPPGPQRAQERPARALITDADARGLAGSTARAILEALEGRRPVRQLAAMLDERATATVRTMQLGGLRWPVRRATIVAVHVFQPCHEAVEAVVTFRCDQRTRVLAMRIDRVCRRWVVTAVRVG